MMAAIFPRATFCIIGTILWAFGALSSQPVRILTVTDLSCMFAVSAETTLHSLLGCSIMDEPAPRSHTTSMGHPQFRSTKSVLVSLFRS